jgi:hypothetical protein
MYDPLGLTWLSIGIGIVGMVILAGVISIFTENFWQSLLFVIIGLAFGISAFEGTARIQLCIAMEKELVPLLTWYVFTFTLFGIFVYILSYFSAIKSLEKGIITKFIYNKIKDSEDTLKLVRDLKSK